MKLTILMYHRVEDIPPDAAYPTNFVRPAQFRDQLAALRDWGYHGVTFADWLASRGDRRVPLPKRPLIVTFDDGYRSMLDGAWPAIRAHGWSATTFLVTGHIGGTNAWDPNERPAPLLTADDVLALRREGMTFGSHTRSHRPLTHLPAPAVEAELAASRRDLERLLGEPVWTLAYPFNNQNADVREAARRAGYRAAVRGTGRMNRRSTDPLALGRIKVDYRMSVSDLRWRLARARWLRL
ncbi:MAG: polysaccharide deacetylase family protein [Gemmatimonadaceae bacterium]